MTSPAFTIHELSTGASVAASCERILRALPAWFGIDAAIVRYVESIARLPTFIATATHNASDVRGFLSLEIHNESSAEIHVMGVAPEAHRTGVGRALVEHAETFSRSRGIEYLHVKTLGPSRENADYERTRAFYRSLGFRPLEERDDIWGPRNPCLFMVKFIGR